jgi:hypothetical protein
MSSHKDRHKRVECNVCHKTMRADTLMRHKNSHADLYSMNETETRVELRLRNEVYRERERRKQEIMSIAQMEDIPTQCYEELKPSTVTNAKCVSLREELTYDNAVYLETIELGRQINVIIDEGVVKEESLSRERRKALNLYRKQNSMFNIEDIKLRLWQKDLMELIVTPTAREIIWIRGTKGDEGKTWIQSYLESLYGHARVVRLDVKNSTSNILHVLSKRPLSSTNIFLFNEARSINHETCNYTVLEQIKDGIAMTSKYNNDVIRFRIPNIVIVFSNTKPAITQLSKDRWKIYNITNTGLKCIHDQLWTQRNQRHDTKSDLETKGDRDDDSDCHKDEFKPNSDPAKPMSIRSSKPIKPAPMPSGTYPVEPYPVPYGPSQYKSWEDMRSRGRWC